MTLDAKPAAPPRAAYPPEIRFRNGQWQVFDPFRYGTIACAPTRADLEILLVTGQATAATWLCDTMPRSRPKQLGGRRL